MGGHSVPNFKIVKSYDKRANQFKKQKDVANWRTQEINKQINIFDSRLDQSMAVTVC